MTTEQARSVTAALGLAVAVVCGPMCERARAANGRGPIWIYRDVPKPGAKDPRSKTERLFAPYGFMPAERVNQIAVNPRRPVDPDHPEKGTCIEYSFQFKGLTDWQGVYTLVGGNAWGSKRGIDVQKLLGLPANAVVFCAFRARGEVGGETVTFQCGGVNNGAHPSSLRFPRILDEDPVTLKKGFRDYRIKLRAGSLTNIIDPFCVVARALDNSRKNTITILVDDIRFETAAEATRRSELPRGWRERLARTLFFDYTPTGYDPTAKPPRRPTADVMREDLRAFRRLADEAGLPRGRAGVVLYGCRDGLEQVPALCRELGLSVILGLWDPRDEAEVQRVEALLRADELEDTVAALCIANEPLTFRRATLAQLRRVAERLRRVRAVPMATTEVVQMYGKRELFTGFDFALPNVHALFNVGRPHDPEAGARWTTARIGDLRKEAPPGYLIVIKEVGWPSGPAPAFSEEGQAVFWRALLAHPVAAEVNICVFEASFGGAAWKNEPIAVGGGKKANVGPFWSVLGPAPARPLNPAGRIILGHARRLARRPAP